MNASEAAGPAPTRDRLLSVLRSADAQDRFVAVVVAAFAVAAAAVADWRAVAAAPQSAAVFLAAFTLSVLGVQALGAPVARKRVERLRADARFGAYDRDGLVALVRRVEDALGIPNGRWPVYISRDKSSNAAAETGLLGSLLRRPVSVRLHRQLLHLLDPDELVYVLGHEFAHCAVCYPWAAPLRPLWLGAAAVVGLALAPHAAGVAGWTGVIGAALAAVGVASLLEGRVWRTIRVIEFLCDDVGAQVAGVAPAANAILKLGADAEAISEVQSRCLELGRIADSLDPDDLMRRYQDASPFGVVDAEHAERLLMESVRGAERDARRISIAGFLRYLGEENDQQEEALDRLRAQRRKLAALEVVDWSRPLRERDAKRLTLDEIGAVARALAANPGALLFRIPTELADLGVDLGEDDEDTHPTLRMRLMYLWRNRDAIEEGPFRRWG